MKGRKTRNTHPCEAPSQRTRRSLQYLQATTLRLRFDRAEAAAAAAAGVNAVEGDMPVLPGNGLGGGEADRGMAIAHWRS